MTEVGRSIPRIEARAKVTGRAEYVHHCPTARHGCMARSCAVRSRTAASGPSTPLRPQRRRASAGSSMGEDIRRLIPDPYYGPAFHDQPILALDKVRHIGEPVAVVLADDPHVAEQASQLIDVRVRRTAGRVRRGRGYDLVGHRA